MKAENGVDATPGQNQHKSICADYGMEIDKFLLNLGTQTESGGDLV